MKAGLRWERRGFLPTSAAWDEASNRAGKGLEITWTCCRLIWADHEISEAGYHLARAGGLRWSRLRP